MTRTSVSTREKLGALSAQKAELLQLLLEQKGL